MGLLPSLEGDERTGVSIVRRALEEPIRQIARNAGADGSIVVDKVRSATDGSVGFNAFVAVYPRCFTLVHVNIGWFEPYPERRRQLSTRARTSLTVMLCTSPV